MWREDYKKRRQGIGREITGTSSSSWPTVIFMWLLLLTLTTVIKREWDDDESSCSWLLLPGVGWSLSPPDHYVLSSFFHGSLWFTKGHHDCYPFSVGVHAHYDYYCNIHMNMIRFPFYNKFLFFLNCHVQAWKDSCEDDDYGENDVSWIIV